MSKSLLILSLIMTVLLVSFAGVNAQTTTGSQNATMPVLYDEDGTSLNTEANERLDAGWYYLQSGRQVYYDGAGVYFDPATGLYGGSSANPNGTAGVILNYVPYTGTIMTPGVPNTGLGGNATLTWVILALSGAFAVAGISYMAIRVREGR